MTNGSYITIKSQLIKNFLTFRTTFQLCLKPRTDKVYVYLYKNKHNKPFFWNFTIALSPKYIMILNFAKFNFTYILLK